MELQVSHCFCAEIQTKSNLRRKKDRDKGNIQTTMPMEGSRNHIRRGVSRPYTHVGQHPAQNERFGVHGIFERKKCIADIPKVRKYEISVPKSRILV